MLKSWKLTTGSTNTTTDDSNNSDNTPLWIATLPLLNGRGVPVIYSWAFDRVSKDRLVLIEVSDKE